MGYRWASEYNDRVPLKRAADGELIKSTGRILRCESTNVSMIEVCESGYWLPCTSRKGEKWLERQDNNVQEYEDDDDDSNMSASQLQNKTSSTANRTARRKSLASNSGVLTVMLVRANNLVDTDTGSRSDPYTLVSVGDDVQESAVVEDCLDPVSLAKLNVE